MTRGTSERGSASLELALLGPVFILLVSVAATLGRVVEARGLTDAAARDAARAASLTRAPADATRAATEAADLLLAAPGSACASYDLAVDTAEFTPGGHVTVTIDCHLRPASLPGPSARTVSADFTTVIDRYRAVRP